ncbi:MAG: hypothetical protein IPM29_30910 [Planctomycetes bacterium]|nr:hypothetical protein [Planctomycetota bacterium]
MRESDDDRQTGAEAPPDGLSRLMGQGADDKALRRRLAQRARQEAERALAESAPGAPVMDAAEPPAGERTFEPAVAVPEPAPGMPVRPPAGPVLGDDPAAPRALQNALIVSLVFVIAGLSLPWRAWSAAPGEQPQPTTVAPDRPAETAPRLSARDAELGVPGDPAYHQALMVAMEGDYGLAAKLLERFLERHPDLNPAVARLVHGQLAMYLRNSGELAAALDHERLARPGSQRAYLAEELLQAARVAEQRGDSEALRSAYARFLLQQDTLSPGLRALLGEAWLKLGDSYRAEADAAAGEEAR